MKSHESCQYEEEEQKGVEATDIRVTDDADRKDGQCSHVPEVTLSYSMYTYILPYIQLYFKFRIHAKVHERHLYLIMALTASICDKVDVYPARQ